MFTLRQLIKLLLILLLFAGIFAGCAGNSEPPPPLWNSASYTTIAVLPIHMTISTDAPADSSIDSDLSNEFSWKMAEAASVALRYRGYKILAPLDIGDRLKEDRRMALAVRELAALSGFIEGVDKSRAPHPDVEKDAASFLGETLGADILVLGKGIGEQHSFAEAVKNGVKKWMTFGIPPVNQSPPAYLSVNMVFIDSSNGKKLTRIFASQMPWKTELIDIAKELDRQFRRVPVKVRDQSIQK